MEPTLVRYQIPREAMDRLEARKFEEACALFTEHVSRCPAPSSTAWTLLGKTHLELGRAWDAWQCCQRAWALDPKNILPHPVLVDAYLAVGNVDAARMHADWMRRLREGPAGNKYARQLTDVAVDRVEQAEAALALQLLRAAPW